MKADILKKLRTEKKLTQVELAKKLEVSKSTIGMVESGKQNGGRELTRKVAEFFEVSIDYLEGLTEDRNGSSAKKELLVSNFIEFLVNNGMISDANNIDRETEELILGLVKREAAEVLKKRGK